MVKKKILFLDTETTWFLQGAYIMDSWKLSYYGEPAYIVQLSLILDEFDKDTQEIKNILNENLFFDCVGDMPIGAQSVHHITKEQLRGKPVLHKSKDDLEKILKLFSEVDVICGHNLEYDFNMIQSAFQLAGMEDKVIPFRKKSYCTMQVGKKFPFKFIDKRTGEEMINNPAISKNPKLVELYTYFFWKPFDNAHDASADTTATRACFYEIYKALTTNR